jgi:8-oxo-dGTP pyrophosphatase MutT (NUDIX family)
MSEDTFYVSNKACFVDDDTVLLMQNHDDVWELPGGHLEVSDDDVESALQREVREETSLELYSYDLVRLHKYEDQFAMFWTCQEWDGEVTLSGEHQDYAWVDVDRLDEIVVTWPGLRDLIRDWVQG